MELIIEDLRIPVEKDGVAEYLRSASQKLKLHEKNIQFVKILFKSLDISDLEQFYYNISLVVSTADSFNNAENFPVFTEKIPVAVKAKKIPQRPIIIGFGPAGIFAALELVDCGIKPLIFERGKKIEERTLDVQRFIDQRELNPESNIQFGEGGAGSYSDGKLFSRKRNSEYVDKVLKTFIKFGAPEEIGYVSKPHVGTDVLREVIGNMRNYILSRGGEIFYESKMTDLLISDGEAVGVVINGEKEYRSSLIYLAVGHSARDTHALLHSKGVAMEQKPINVGVRIEHPVETINLMRYGGKYKDFPGIGAATYSFTRTDRQAHRGVNTFCMCPGGEVVNASSENGLLVVNGMSYASRSSAFSNAALVVTCHTDDYKSSHPLAGLDFQKDIERKAFTAGGEQWKVPAQNMMDFLHGSTHDSLNSNSCKTGTTPADLHKIFPPFICEALSAAFNIWKEDYSLFISDRALLLGAETRTSCPVRIKRNEQYESIGTKNLFPIGEGAGYTGGITSSAADAIKAVQATVHI